MSAYTVYNPKMATQCMENIQSCYDDLMNGVTKYQGTLIDAMANAWISPNGAKEVKKAVENMNDFLETVTKDVDILFNSLNSANLNTQVAFIRGAEEYDGYQYKSLSLAKSSKKFDSKEAKTNKGGKLYIYESKLIDLINDFDGYENFVKAKIKSLATEANAMPIEDESDTIAKKISSVTNSISKKIEQEIGEIKSTIKTKLSETDADVVQAKNNALAALKNGS